MKAAEKLEGEGISTQVVSAPCLEWLAEQDGAYRDSLLPKSALKVSIEVVSHKVGANTLAIMA
jgi:transketolase